MLSKFTGHENNTATLRFYAELAGLSFNGNDSCYLEIYFLFLFLPVLQIEKHKVAHNR